MRVLKLMEKLAFIGLVELCAGKEASQPEFKTDLFLCFKGSLLTYLFTRE